MSAATDVDDMAGINRCPGRDVMIIDNVRPTRDSLKLIAEKNDLTSKAVSSGKKAISLHRCGNTYKPIMVNLDMASREGFEVTKQLRDMAVHTPILGFTKAAVEVGSFSDVGVNACYTIPMTPGQFKSAVSQYI